jgi:hypothetical protein
LSTIRWLLSVAVSKATHRALQAVSVAIVAIVVAKTLD